MTLSSGDFRVYMRQLAGWVWREQKDAFSYNLVLQEESITETLLLRMSRELTPFGFRVQLFNRIKEGGLRRSGKVFHEGHGADWEWFYETPDCMVSFRVQAKRLWHQPNNFGRYASFDPTHNQVQNLINRAGQANPIYVFYNHPGVHDADLFEQSGAPDYFGRSCWGCSVATADFMKRARDNKLSTIFPGQVPWHKFFGIGRVCRAKKAMATMSGEQEFKTTHERPEWVNILLENEQSRDEQLDRLLQEQALKGIAYFNFS